MKLLTITVLAEAIQRSCAKDTSADPDGWNDENPTWGHCAVAALVIQDWFGGALMRTQAKGSGFDWGHYWNRLPNGLDVDATRRQFPVATTFERFETRTRDQLLDPTTNPKNAKTKERYQTFRKRVDRELQKRGYFL